MSKLSIRCWDTASQHQVCISSLVSHCSFFSPLLCLECGPRDNKALWCVCMCQREGGRKTEGVWGRVVGERWRWSRRSTGVVVTVRFAGGGVFFLAVALVLIETSNMTKTGLTGRVNGAAVTEQLYSASHTPRSPLSSRPALPYFSFMPPLLLYELISSARHQCRGSIWCVRAWCVCPRTCQGAVWDLHIRGRKRYKWSCFKKKKKRWAQMSFTSRGGAGGE